MKIFADIPTPPSPFKALGTSDYCRQIHAWEKENQIKFEDWMKLRDKPEGYIWELTYEI